MRMRYAISLGLGLLLAGAVVVAARVSLDLEPAETGALVPVYVASEDIAFGAPVRRDLVTTQLWPAEAVPPQAFTDPAVLWPDGQGARRAKAHLFAGEPLIANKLSAYGEDVTEIPILDPARRAMLISAKGAAVEAGLVAPGDRIDLVLLLGQGEDRSAVLFQQNLHVLGVRPGGQLAVEIARSDAQKLALAQEAGELIATLHLGGDVPEEELETVFLNTLVEEGKIVADTETVDRPTILVRRGNETYLVPVPLGGN